MRDDFFFAIVFEEDKPVLFNFLEDNDLIDIFFTQVYVCVFTNYIFEYPFKDYERGIVPALRNISLKHKFHHQKASWNSQFETVFAKRLTSHGFGYSFNILDVAEILNVEE